MSETIRVYQVSDEAAVVALSLRAWAPVFATIEKVIGREINLRLHGRNWRTFQEAAVRETLAEDATSVWVAQRDGAVIGFVAANVVDADRRLGEITMLAVDPDHQQRGTGTQLTEFATEWLRQAGMSVAVIGTGGDPGHAPARRVYEKADYTALPAVQYFKAL